MRPRLLDLIRCPGCNGSLEMKAYAEEPERHAVPAWVLRPGGYDRNITQGHLYCAPCQALYPIISGVPRLYFNAWKDFPEWLRRARGEMPHLVFEPVAEPRGITESRRSFSAEWASHASGDATWIWPLKERLDYFKEEVGLDPSSLGHPLVLDGGCGNGELTNGLTTLGAEAVGLDLSNSVERAERLRTSAMVHYVQGNLLNPPLGMNLFDVIYSSGVLHHTPDPRGAFAQLGHRLKPGGRIYIWMYGTPNEQDLPAYNEKRRRSYRWKPWVMKMPFALQRIAVRGIALRVWLRNKLKGPERSLTFSRALVGAYDSHTPYFRSHHHYAELEKWYHQEGFVGMRMTGVREPGFGIHGDLAR